MLTVDASDPRATRGDVGAVIAEEVRQRHRRDRVALRLRAERGRLVEAAADEQADDHDDRAEPERDAPAPAEQLLVGQRADRQEHRGRDDEAGLGAAEREAREERAAMVVGVLEAQRVRTRLLAGGREALHEPQRDQQRRRPQADGVVRRQAADEERGQPHERDGEQEHPLAAVPVAEMPHEEGADRARDVADPVGGEGQQRARRRVRLREEDLPEDQGGRRAVDEEVVVLEDAADPARERRLPRRPRDATRSLLATLVLTSRTLPQCTD